MNIEAMNRISKIIKTEATTTSRGDFLITHVPFSNLYLDANQSESISENDLLQDVILNNTDEHKFIMVQGGNGSGKSHLIRWLKEKYCGLIDSDKEAVLLISRAHNTLQDALTQLLESDIFPEEIRENELKTIKNAKSNITGDELKKTINFNFTLEVEADENNDVTLVDNRIRKWLVTYLNDKYIQDNFLLVSNGPIERIRAKIENVTDDVVDSDDNPMFTPDDFKITINDIATNLKKADGRSADFAIRLAEKFADVRKGEELRKNVASYLNTKVANVIQRSMKLQTADFKKLFASLRKTLKSQGMNLTLFVEDINSFTGIDEALMEVLLTDHCAEGNEDYCRLISVVGSTNDFYNHKINESIKERIKTNIYIKDTSIISNSNELAQFAARYINAIYLTENQVSSWVESGANDNDLPIHKDNHNWANVDCNGNVLSIFPFNQTALWKLFKSLAPEKRTPRIIIRSIIAHVLKLWIASPENFLSNENNFKNNDVEIPYWISDNYDRGNKEIDKNTAVERGILLRLWGDGTTVSSNGKLGGLSKDVFETFNVYYDSISSVNVNTDIADEPDDIEVEVPEPVHVVDEPKRESKPQNLVKIELDLREWLNNKSVLSVHAEMRDIISNFITSGIEWNTVNVPDIMKQYINVRGRIQIEGQNVGITDGFFIPRNEESYHLMVALAYWKYLGNNSWHFTDSADYLVMATSWLEKNKDTIVKSVIAPPDREEEWNISLWNVAALYCIKTLFGGVDITKTSEDILIDLFKIKPDFTDESIHSNNWNEIKSTIVKNSDFKNKLYDDSLKYFSKSVGTAIQGATKYRIIDAYEIIKNIDELKEINWDLSKICPENIPNSKTTWYCSANLINVFISKIDSAIESDMNKSNSLVQFFNCNFDNKIDEQSISATLDSINDFLRFLTRDMNLNYSEDDFRCLQPVSMPRSLSRDLNNLVKLNDTNDKTEKLMRLSFNPFDITNNLYIAFEKFIELLSEKSLKFSNSIDKTTMNSIDVYQKDIIEKINNMESLIGNVRV